LNANKKQHQVKGGSITIVGMHVVWGLEASESTEL